MDDIKWVKNCCSNAIHCWVSFSLWSSLSINLSSFYQLIQYYNDAELITRESTSRIIRSHPLLCWILCHNYHRYYWRRTTITPDMLTHIFAFSQPRGKNIVPMFRYLNVAVVNKLPNQQLLNWTFWKTTKTKDSDQKWNEDKNINVTPPGRRLTHFSTLHTRQHPPASPMKKFETFSAQTSRPHTHFPSVLSYLTRSPHRKRKQVGFYGWTTLFLLQFIKKSIISFSYVSLHSTHGWLVLRLFYLLQVYTSRLTDWKLREREWISVTQETHWVSMFLSHSLLCDCYEGDFIPYKRRETISRKQFWNDRVNEF